MEPVSEKGCRNCSHPMSELARFCPTCGQKYSTGKVPAKAFIQDFFSQYFNLDSRLFRTAAALLKPGKLTIEYFMGKHKSYANPLQLFLVPAFFLFAFVSWNIANSDLGENGILELKQELDWIDFYAQLDTAKQKTDSLFRESIAHDATDSLVNNLKSIKGHIRDSIELDSIGVSFSDIAMPSISKEDLLLKSPDELAEIYGKDRGFIVKILLRQASKFKQGGRGIIEYFISKLSITLLVMMPFLALILKLLYIRSDYYYVEHLVFTLHFHAFAFLLILILGLIGSYLPEWLLALSHSNDLLYIFIWR